MNKDIVNAILIGLLWFSAWGAMQYISSYYIKEYDLKPKRIIKFYIFVTITILFLLYFVNKNTKFLTNYGV